MLFVGHVTASDTAYHDHHFVLMSYEAQATFHLRPVTPGPSRKRELVLTGGKALGWALSRSFQVRAHCRGVRPCSRRAISAQRTVPPWFPTTHRLSLSEG